MPLAGKRLSVFDKPDPCLTRFRRSAESSQSWMVKAGSKPMGAAYSRSRRAPIPWYVPAQVRASVIALALSPRRRRAIRSSRRVISEAARREKVIRSMRRGGAAPLIRWATRRVRVLVFPEPAPAMMRRGGADNAVGSDAVLDGPALLRV